MQAQQFDYCSARGWGGRRLVRGPPCVSVDTFSPRPRPSRVYSGGFHCRFSSVTDRPPFLPFVLGVLRQLRNLAL